MLRTALAEICGTRERMRGMLEVLLEADQEGGVRDLVCGSVGALLAAQTATLGSLTRAVEDLRVQKVTTLAILASGSELEHATPPSREREPRWDELEELVIEETEATVHPYEASQLAAELASLKTVNATLLLEIETLKAQNVITLDALTTERTSRAKEVSQLRGDLQSAHDKSSTQRAQLHKVQAAQTRYAEEKRTAATTIAELRKLVASEKARAA